MIELMKQLCALPGRPAVRMRYASFVLEKVKKPFADEK